MEDILKDVPHDHKVDYCDNFVFTSYKNVLYTYIYAIPLIAGGKVIYSAVTKSS